VAESLKPKEVTRIPTPLFEAIVISDDKVWETISFSDHFSPL
jgi:hypothetical protein